MVRKLNSNVAREPNSWTNNYVQAAALSFGGPCRRGVGLWRSLFARTPERSRRGAPELPDKAPGVPGLGPTGVIPVFAELQKRIASGKSSQRKDLQLPLNRVLRGGATVRFCFGGRAAPLGG